MNLANNKTWTFSVYKTVERKAEQKCVFISHKKEDSTAAVVIGTYLMSLGINIYLDQNDMLLQEAVSQDNDQKIVSSIKRGLSVSTHLLCLISDKTKLSWWVPYEIGTAESQDVIITSLKLKGIDDLPSFLKIQPVLYNMEEFAVYAHQLTRYGGVFTKDKPVEITQENKDLLSPYLD